MYFENVFEYLNFSLIFTFRFFISLNAHSCGIVIVLLLRTIESDVELFSYQIFYAQQAMATEEDSFEQVAAARKERLKALRAAQELLNASDEKNSVGEDKENGATADTDET